MELATINEAKTKETIDINFIRMFNDGPAVSLKGSPTVSPTTPALWESDPLPPKAPRSIYFLALSHDPPELAIIIGNKDYWGKGVGEEAGSLIVAHGFKAMNLHRIYCGTSKENIGMQKLAVKLGLKKDGVLREALFKNGKFQDIINYSILENEYKK